MIVRRVSSADEAQWKPLYRAYRDFYELGSDETVVARVWAWLLDDAVDLHGLVAVHTAGGQNGSGSSSDTDSADDVQGIAIYRFFLEPSTGTSGLYLEDLFVAPERRGVGTATTLLRHLAGLAAAEGHAVVRWVTAQDNARARRVYDSLATATSWVTYDMEPVGADQPPKQVPQLDAGGA